MNMQPAVHSRSSANGFGRRRGERDVGTRLENRSQSGKSNSNNRLTSTGSKTGGHGSPLHDRLVYITTCFVGQHVDVHVKNGSIYSGIFHAANEKDFDELYHIHLFVTFKNYIEDGSLDKRW